MIEKLTEREQEIFELVRKNKTNHEIAQEICMSIETVKKDLKNIYLKLEIESSNDPEKTHSSRRKILLFHTEKEKMYSLREIRKIAESIFSETEMKTLNDLLSFIKIREQETKNGQEN